MRSLIVDNYDSFTYNLFHLLAIVNGEEPEVIRNDEPDWDPERLRDFDNVVISPGPGHPEKQCDFGICASLVRHCRLPLLGVCLGHQGLSSALGGKVEIAPEPYHGRISQVFHAGAGLFEGVPSPFYAVRYHSLVVTAVPEELEVIAWTADNLVMAVRHRSRPAWGLQFHPESICTEYGERILRNFSSANANLPNYHPRRAKPRQKNLQRPPTRITISSRELRLKLDPETVFDELFAASPFAFWLDSSSLTGAENARFSVMGDNTGPLSRCLTYQLRDRQLTLVSSTATEQINTGFFDWLENNLASFRADTPELPFAFAPGWIGYIGYELKAECGGDVVHHSTHPDAAMIFADRVILFDHCRGSVWLVAVEHESVPQWQDDMEARLTQLASRDQGLSPALQAEYSNVQLRIQETDYLDRITTCKKAIREGESYEICLTNSIGARTNSPPWSLYRQLRATNGTPFGAFFRFGPLAVLSSSPERFLSISPGGIVESRPMKGTRARATDAAQDRKIAAELAASEKDRAENLMIVDLVRNDLGRCAETGTVEVTKLFAVETYASVHQLVSTVRAKLRPGCSAVDCVRAAFPGGSMTGAPKIRTMQFIDRLEGGPRGIYSGCIGYWAVTGAVDLSMVIRTAVLNNGILQYGIGGAITALSDPHAEFEETMTKARPLMQLFRRTAAHSGTGADEEDNILLSCPS